MQFEPLPLEGPLLVKPRAIGDSRGSFARVFCPELFGAQGLPTQWAQVNVSFSAKAGTVRGMHFQRPPAQDAKYLRCVRGAIRDVLLDMRAGSATYGQTCLIDLSDKDSTGLFIPTGFAHGFQTRTDDTELHYFHSAPYAPEHEDGVNATDPDLGLDWPMEISEMSDRDRALRPLANVEPIAL